MARPHKLEYFGTGTVATDISESIETVDKFTDVGTGEIVSAKLMLDARFGDFVTEANSGQTPIIQQYDLFKLAVTDDDDNSYTRYLIQDDIAPQKNNNGSHLVLELFGRERYLQKMYFPGHFFFISFKDMVIKIRDFYNKNRGSLQPNIKVSGTDINDIPKHSYGIFEFGKETTVYDALMEVIKRLSLPVAAGGAGEYYGLTFSDTSHSIFMRIRPRGSLPSSPLVLKKPISITELKQPIEGNIMVVEGQEGSGSFPKEPALWRSLVEEFDNLPLWDDSIQYEKDAFVRYNDKIYQSRAKHNAANITPTVTVSWSVIKFSDYVKDYTGSSDFQYSPTTNKKQAPWRNWGGNAGALNNNSFFADNIPTSGQNAEGVDYSAYDALCITDSNLVIRDRNAWRDWVDFRVASLSDIPDEYLYDSTTENNTIQKRSYHGMRVLIDPAKGTAAAPFAGNDKLGHPFENSLAMQDRDGDWIVFKRAEQFVEAAVIHEGKVYEYNTPLQTSGGTVGQGPSRSRRNKSSSLNLLAWRNTSEVLLGNDPFHYPTVFENVEGLIGEDPNSPVTLDITSTKKYTDNSAIKIEYKFGESDIIEKILNTILSLSPLLSLITFFANNGNLKAFTEDEQNLLYKVEIYNVGWWATLFEAPSPKSTYGGISESVGELFGGDADNKRPILDLQNLNHTPSGKTGYNNMDSDLMGPIDGIKGLLNFSISGIDLDALRGDLPFRCTIYDLLGNVWISDTTHRFQDDTYEFDFPLSSFTIYRARIQPAFTLSNAISRIINPELKLTEIFDRRLVKRINLQCMVAYDDEGRYDPLTWEYFIRKLITVATNTDVKYTGIIDAVHFTKTPIVIARDTTDPTNSVSHRHLMAPIKKYPGISNVVQLQKIADSELAIAKHKKDLWTAKYTNRVDLKAEDSVYVNDADFISESDKTGVDNTRKLIVNKITYSVGDRRSNSGLVSSIELFRKVAT